jgi:lipid-binding SYLF domain-containing protein
VLPQTADGYLAPLQDAALSSQVADDDVADSQTSTLAQTFKRIPPRIIQNAAGIAIFTCMRSGLWMTGSGGSGIIIARKADGTWSPPAGIMLHTPTLSFIIGVDIYDCVLVINNMAALEALITKPKVVLGEDIGLTQGPLVSLDSTEDDRRWREFDDTVLIYLKARGQAQVVNLHGCILAERANENERFYSAGVAPADILAGNVSRSVDETRPLFEVIKAAEGRIDADVALINQIAAQPAPGDAVIATPRDSLPASPTSAFGLPGSDDPDPFGVLALEMAGLEIREAGTRLRPSSRQFDYSPSPTSPSFSKFSRQSIQTLMSDSNRGSYMSTRTERTKVSDANGTPNTTPCQCPSDDGAAADNIPVLREPDDHEVDYTKIDLTPLRKISGSQSVDGATMTDSSVNSADEQSRAGSSITDDAATKASSVYTKDEELSQDGNDDDLDDADDEGDESCDDEEEAVIYEVASLQPAARSVMVASPIHVKGALVNIPKRIPPPLPARSAARVSRARSDIGDVSHLHSPVASVFTPSPRRSLDEEATRNEVSGSPITQQDKFKVEISAPEPAPETNAGPALKSPGSEPDAASLEVPSQAAPGAFPSSDEDSAKSFALPARNPNRRSRTDAASTATEELDSSAAAPTPALTLLPVTYVPPPKDI